MINLPYYECWTDKQKYFYAYLCKQFRFRKEHSAEHAILQLVEQINQSFEKNEFTLGVFVDLSKALDKVGYEILLKK